MPLTLFQSLHLGAVERLPDLASEHLDVGLGVGMITKGEEVRPVRSGDDDGDVTERFEQTVDDLLVVAGVRESICRIRSLITGIEPSGLGIDFVSIG